jgi:protein involved in polysaccharide export with SLBB domain
MKSEFGRFVFFCWATIVLLLFGAPSRVAVAAGDMDYELAVGDIVEFDLLDDDELPRQFTIANDGRVLLPLVGGVAIAGLPISQAVEEIRTQYVQKHLLKDPKIALSIATFRPIFVLGDVKNPGSFPFHPLLTVEQAVGLAGGPLTVTTNLEDRILARSRLRSDIEGAEAQIAREGMVSGRLSAVLDNRSTIDMKDIPESARAYLNGSYADTLKAGEERLLAADNEQFKTQKGLLIDGINEANSGLKLLDELMDKQRSSIQYSQDDLARATGLLKKGLKTASEISGLQRQVTADEARLLTILAQAAEGRRGMSALKRQLSDLEENRKKDNLAKLQEQAAKIEQLQGKRLAAEEQLFLVTNWTSEEARKNQQLKFDFRIRHRSRNGNEEQTATVTSSLAPGDVLLVTIIKPETDFSLPGGVGTTGLLR